VSLTYDALGRMVEQNRSSVYTELVYGPNGGKLALMNGQTVQKAFVPLPGKAVAVYNSTGLDHYRHPDWLGSSRFASTSARGMYFEVAYAPFGEPYAQSGTTDLSFTGQNQDTVGGGLTGLYDFPAREYSTQGRWPSPDPGGLGAVAFSDPQTLNRYAYVRNGPLTLTDPSGMYAFGDCWWCGFGFDFERGFGPYVLGGWLGGWLWNPNGIGSNIGSIWGEQSPWGLPPWLTASGFDWQSLIFGPPNLADFTTPPFLEPGTAYYDGCPPEKRRFFDWLDEPLGGMATDLNVREPLLLTLAAKEGGWDDRGLNHNIPLNNPFGVNKIIKGKAAGNIQYASLSEAISEWERMWGDRVRDVDTREGFVNGLQHPRIGKPYNTADPRWAEKYMGIDMQKWMNNCGIQ